MAWTSAVIGVFGRLGVEEKATRQALMRTAAAGWLRAERVGRRTRWHLTDAAVVMLTEGAERIYSFTGATLSWDGRWLVVAVRMPDGDRSARHIVRTRLNWAGFGSLGPGLWISPHPEREGEVVQVLREAGLAGDAHLFVGTRSGVEDVRAMVSAAWDLAAIEQHYEQFIDEFSGRGHEDVLTRQIELVHAWRRFPAIDPALPRELLPPGWSGATAARLFERRHAQWAADAMTAWRALDQGQEGTAATPLTRGAVS
jgi:phenylacetic acid degradation operon negative regulatory protein